MPSLNKPGFDPQFAPEKPETIAGDLSAWENEGGASPSSWVEDRLLSASLADEEEQIRRRLGASVIARWRALPAGVQRGLFQHATAESAVCDSIKLKVQIARFLHVHAG